MKILSKIAILLIILCFVNTDINLVQLNHIQPSDLSIMYDEKEMHKKRDKWIEMMHKTAPGQNWRHIEQKNRFERIRKKNESSDLDTSLRFLNGSWREIGSNNLAGRVLKTEYDYLNEKIVSASDGGNIWITDYDEIDWSVINDQFKINDVCFLKIVDDSRLLVASSTWSIEGFFYTDDLGENWDVAQGLSEIADWGKINRVVLNAQGEIFLLAVEWNDISWQKKITIYKSIDNGESFESIISFDESEVDHENKVDIWTTEEINAPIYVLAGGVFYTIENDNLNEIGTFPQDEGNVILNGYIANEDTTFIVANYSNNYTSFYASLNAGKNWTALSSINENPFRNNSFLVSKTNKNNLFFGGINCYRSFDMGASWTKINNWDEYYSDIEYKLHADIPSIDMFEIDNEDVYFVSTDGGLYLSKDSLQNVQNISLDKHNISQYYSVYTSRINVSHIHAGSQDQGFQNSHATITTDPINFRQVISGDYGHIVSSDFGASIWMVYPGFIIYYSDIVNSDKSYMQNFDFQGHLWMPPLMADPENPTGCYLGGGNYGSGSKIIHVTKLSERLNFEALEFEFNNATNVAISAMAYSSVNSDYRYLLNSEGEFFYSTDKGASWDKTTDFTAPEHHYFYGSTILPSKVTLGKVYVGGSGYSNAPVYVTYDNGETFEEMRNGLPSTLVYKLDSDEDDNFIFAATESGPYVYDVAQEQWFNISFGQAPDQTYWDVDYVENLQVARFATYGRGIWDYMVNSENSIDQLSTQKNLAQVFPNPSDGNFSIKFEEHTTWPKQIEIFNIYGQKVYSKEISYSYPSKYDVSLLKNPGYYFVKITNTEGTEVVKILLQ